MFKRTFKGSIGSCFVTGLAAISVFALAGDVLAAGTAVSREFNEAGHILIADQFNNRVIEVDTKGTIVWSFGLGPNDFSAQSIIGVNDAQRVGRFTLMAGTGTPAGVIPQAPNGAVDNRVILVSPKGKIVWLACAKPAVCSAPRAWSGAPASAASRAKSSSAIGWPTRATNFTTAR